MEGGREEGGHGRAPVITHGPVTIQGPAGRRLSRSGAGGGGLPVGVADTSPGGAGDAGDAGDAGASGPRPH